NTQTCTRQTPHSETRTKGSFGCSCARHRDHCCQTLAESKPTKRTILGGLLRLASDFRVYWDLKDRIRIVGQQLEELVSAEHADRQLIAPDQGVLCSTSQHTLDDYAQRLIVRPRLGPCLHKRTHDIASTH